MLNASLFFVHVWGGLDERRESGMISRISRLFLALTLAVLAVSGTRTVYPSSSQNIAMRPLDLDPAHPGPRRVGDLVFVNAWELQSANAEFGGISALLAMRDGRFIGVSDAGTLIGFGLTDDDRIDRPFIAPLPESVGPDLTYQDRDSEGITYDPETGQFWVSYEANHAIRRFSKSFARRTGYVRLGGKHHWAKNKGVEAVARMADGRFVAINENLEQGLHEGFLFSGDPVESGTVKTSFDYRPPKGYRVTDISALPDGRLIVLNRKVGFPNGFSAKIALLDPADIGVMETVEGRVITTLASPLLIDNMEGIAVSVANESTIIWLISDDNFSVFQRTLLMKFRLSERQAKKKPEAVAAPGFESL
jgi:hypothetical protein